VACGLAAILGHMFPVWLRFKGGKGVATTTGVFAALVPLCFAIAGAAWILVAAATRYVSLASIALAVAFPAAVVALDPRAFHENWPITALACASAVFIAVRHVPNLRRVLARTEPRIGESKRSPAAESNNSEGNSSVGNNSTRGETHN
jgi:glycerol-3-phosphate acyltransferase PlsY